jgi:hypothetical protein
LRSLLSSPARAGTVKMRHAMTIKCEMCFIKAAESNVSPSSASPRKPWNQAGSPGLQVGEERTNARVANLAVCLYPRQPLEYQMLRADKVLGNRHGVTLER